MMRFSCRSLENEAVYTLLNSALIFQYGFILLRIINSLNDRSPPPLIETAWNWLKEQAMNLYCQNWHPKRFNDEKRKFPQKFDWKTNENKHFSGTNMSRLATMLLEGLLKPNVFSVMTSWSVIRTVSVKMVSFFLRWFKSEGFDPLRIYDSSKLMFSINKISSFPK